MPDLTTETQLDELEREAVKALLLWVEEHPLVAEDGRPMISSDGKPVALEVLNVIGSIRHSSRR
jgi:hypothetical protein